MTSWGTRAAPAASTPWAAATTEFLRDTFTGGPEAITAHTSDSGATWAYSDAGLSGVVTVSGGFATLTTLSSQEVIASATAPSNSYDIAATVTRRARSGTVQIALDLYAIRDFNEGELYTASYYVNVPDNRCELDLTGGSLNLATNIALLAVDASATVTLRVNGSAISLLVDGVAQLSGTDSSYASRPTVGFGLIDNDATNGTALELTTLTATTLAPTASTPATTWGARSAP